MASAFDFVEVQSPCYEFCFRARVQSVEWKDDPPSVKLLLLLRARIQAHLPPLVAVMTHPLSPVVLARSAVGVGVKMMWSGNLQQHNTKELLVARYYYYFDVESLVASGRDVFFSDSEEMCQIKTQQLLLAVPAVANHLQMDMCIQTRNKRNTTYGAITITKKKAWHHREMLWIEETTIKSNVTYHRSQNKI
eukprot:scaffold855_cov140-Skeletonema_menzelii.AAC.2